MALRLLENPQILTFPCACAAAGTTDYLFAMAPPFGRRGVPVEDLGPDADRYDWVEDATPLRKPIRFVREYLETAWNFSAV